MKVPHNEDEFADPELHKVSEERLSQMSAFERKSYNVLGSPVISPAVLKSAPHFSQHRIVLGQSKSFLTIPFVLHTGQEIVLR